MSTLRVGATVQHPLFSQQRERLVFRGKYALNFLVTVPFFLQVTCGTVVKVSALEETPSHNIQITHTTVQSNLMLDVFLFVSNALFTIQHAYLCVEPRTNNEKSSTHTSTSSVHTTAEETTQPFF